MKTQTETWSTGTYQRLYRALANGSAALVSACGVIVLFGWYLNDPLLMGAMSASITVKTNTAIALLLSGLSLWLQAQPSAGRLAIGIGRAAGLLVFAIGGLTFLEHLTHWDLGIDELIFKEAPGAAGTTSPNRMGPPAAIAFVLSGAGLYYLRSRNLWHQRFAFLSALAVGAIGLLPTLGYLFAAASLYGVARYTGIALPTAIALMAVSLGTVGALAGNPSPTSPAALLSASGAGAILVRRLLPPALLLPPFLGYLRTLGEQAGFYDAPFGRALLILVVVLIFGRLVWSSGREVERIDKERLELLERERTARGHAEAASRLKDEFLATLSHELRTPLNAILGWSQIIQRSRDVAPDVAKGIETIERNARLQAQLIEDLLDMSRIISGKLRLDLRHVDIAVVLEAAVQTVEPEAAAKDIRIRQDVPVGIGFVAGDTERLQQVFWNLLSNSLKFTPPGGTITVAMNVLGDVVEIAVTDTGEGLSEVFLKNVFERFRQADASATRRHGGLGIGLSIVRDLVSMHHGSVSAQSPGKGKGSTFTVQLPLAGPLHTSGAQHPAADQRSLPSPSDYDVSGIRVLIVDDEPDARQLMQRILEQGKAIVTVADSAHAALLAIEKEAPDILVSDIGMPGEDGYQLIRRVRKNSRALGQSIPAIALTAYVRPEDIQRALEAGYQKHLSKPVDAPELIGAVKALTSAARSTAQPAAAS